MSTATESGEELDEREIHEVLGNDRRRLALEALREGGGEESVRTLSEQIAAHETGEDPPPKKKRQSVYVSLHQTHLPKLDRLDVVTYDDAREVRLDERIEEVRVFMEVVPKYGLSWGEYYLALAVLGGVTLVANTIGVPVIGAVPAWAVGLGFVLAVAVSAVYNVHSQEGGWPFSRLL